MKAVTALLVCNLAWYHLKSCNIRFKSWNKYFAAQEHENPANHPHSLFVISTLLSTWRSTKLRETQVLDSLLILLYKDRISFWEDLGFHKAGNSEGDRNSWQLSPIYCPSQLLYLAQISQPCNYWHFGTDNSL